MELKSLYQDLILDHGKNPRNFKSLDKPCDSIVAHNPLCGDKIEIFALLERDIIKDISFRGNGCAICLAASSIMTELVIKKNINETKLLIDFFLKKINKIDTSKLPKISKEESLKINSFSSVSNFPMRIKCATLPWLGLNSLLFENKKEINIDKV